MKSINSKYYCLQVESIQASAAGREAELTLKLEDHAKKVHDREMLNDQVLQLQSELQLAQSIVTAQVRHLNIIFWFGFC